MLSMLLGFSNIDVASVHTVNDALHLAQNTLFDLSMLESRFPDGDGFELCSKAAPVFSAKADYFLFG